jgi:hypothetical protein
MPKKEPARQLKVGDKIRVNLHHGKIEDAVVKPTLRVGNVTREIQLPEHGYKEFAEAEKAKQSDPF